MIFIVEDNPHFSHVIENVLKKLGYNFEIVDNGTQALRRILEDGKKYALILLDLGLPNTDGLQVARAIRAIDDDAKAKVPIVAMTGGATPMLSASDEQIIHFAATLTKPFMVRDLSSIIEHCSRWVPKHDESTDLPSDIKLE